MSIRRIILVAVILFIAFPGQVVLSLQNAEDQLQLGSMLQTMVLNIIAGTNIQAARSSVDIEAYIVDGKHFESLYDAVRGQSPHCRLIEGNDSQFLFQKLIIADQKNAAFMVLKTSSREFGERFHSIVFFRENSDQWKIKSWHVSN